MLLRDFFGRSVEFHLYTSSGVDFAEDWLNAGCLPRDADGVYLVDSVDNVIVYTTDAINGCNPDFDGKLKLIFGLCEGVFFLRKITITIDDVTLDCLRAMRELNGTPYSAAIRRAVLAYYQDKAPIPPAKEK